MDFKKEPLKNLKNWVDYVSLDDGEIPIEGSAYITTGDVFLWTQFGLTFKINDEEHEIRFSLNPEIMTDWVKAFILKGREGIEE